jgi:hypothetical protein
VWYEKYAPGSRDSISSFVAVAPRCSASTRVTYNARSRMGCSTTPKSQPRTRVRACAIYTRVIRCWASTYTTRHTKISYSLAYQCSQVNLPATPPDTPRLATASQVNVRRSTYLLHHQTHQDQLQPRRSMFTGQLTSYTTRHTKIRYSLAYQCSQVNLPPNL